MKTSVFKQLSKEAVKEVFQEEMKSILLEAVRAPKTIVNESLRDSYVKPSKNTYAQPHIENPRTLSPEERRAMFGNIIENMSGNSTITTNDMTTFVPRSVDAVNGSLPEGNVGLDQIMGLMKK
jgi:hypothetical protein